MIKIIIIIEDSNFNREVSFPSMILQMIHFTLLGEWGGGLAKLVGHISCGRAL